jgi:hypothetical protein
MASALELGRQVAAILARSVKGRVWLVFFDVTPRGTEVTGMTYEDIQQKTRSVTAGGGTSIGCGLLGILEANVEVDGIAVVSDGGENTTPMFADVYKRYSDKFGKAVPVYLYQTEGEANMLVPALNRAAIDVQVFDLRDVAVDYNSVVNLVQTMRTNRYSLVQQILDTPLLTLNDVLGSPVAYAGVD